MSVENPDRPARETRLLALVVVVAIVVLVILSRFRFPATGLTSATPATGPLAGLAARATFDDMAAALTGVLTRVSPMLVAVELGAVPLPEPVPSVPAPGRGVTGRSSAAAEKPSPAPTPSPLARLMSALRVRRDIALVYAAGGARPLPAPDGPAALEVLALDADREIAVIRVPGANDAASLAVHDGFSGFSYVAVIESTRSGPTVRPRFIGRVSPVIDPRWSVPLLSIGEPTDIQPGAWLFRLDGAVVGLAVRGPDGVAIVPASALDEIVRKAAADAAASGGTSSGDAAAGADPTGDARSGGPTS